MFYISKRAFNVIVEPWDSNIDKALRIIQNKDPSILTNVKKVVVHSGGGGGQLGHVEKGPGKDPQEIHIFKDRIRQIVEQRAGGPQTTLTHEELQEAIIDSMTETLYHEAVHIGKGRTPEQIQKDPFLSEPEAERESAVFMKKVHSSKIENKNILPRNFAVVIPKTLYRGGIINNIKQLEYLKSLGVKRIVSLHENSRVPQLCKIANIECIQAFIENGSPEEFGRKVLGNSVSNFLTQKPTYVHCYYGEDRTGGVIARVRTEMGWPCDKAYKEAKSFGFKDVFIDLIDWFSEPCDKKPINTDKIREMFGDIKPYKNPEKQEQDCASLTPVPNDVPFPSTIPGGYTSYITNPTPMGIFSIPFGIKAQKHMINILLANLINKLTKIGSTQAVVDVNNILNDIIDEDSTENEIPQNNDVSSIVNIVGLQEDGVVQNMNQGYTLEPFFSDYGKLG
jgi:protein tyrosine/serine phosphatase